MSISTIEIFFGDLIEEKQKEICDEWGTTPEEENWDTIPLTSIDRELFPSWVVEEAPICG